MPFYISESILIYALYIFYLYTVYVLFDVILLLYSYILVI